MDGTLQALLGLVVAPGVALLVLSTAIRFQTLEDQVRRVEQGLVACSIDYLANLKKRAHRFRRALVALYAALALIAMAALVGLVAVWLTLDVTGPTLTVIGLAIGLILFAISQLLLEATGSIDVVVEQIEHVSRKHVEQSREKDEVTDER